MGIIKKHQFIYVILLVGFISCQKELEPIDIVQESVKVHGTMEAWKNIKSLSFTKKTQLFNEDGSLKQKIVQDQEFQFGNEYSASIYSHLDSTSYHLKEGQIHTEIGDYLFVLGGKELKSKQRLFKSALYVTSQPFQLIESGARFERKQDTLFGEKKVFAIRVHYKGDTSASDQWTYYFDQNTFEVVACSVQHNDRISVIENTSYDSATPFLFNSARKSTIMNGGKSNFVIAEYEYSNYKVEFK